jgi:hypothetical protein
MQRTSHLWWSIVTVSMLAFHAVATPDRAAACSGIPPCDPAAVLPGEAGRMPVNMAQFFYSRAADTDVQIAVIAPGYILGDAPPEVPLELIPRELGGVFKLPLVVVKPTQPLTAGSLLRIRYSPGCGEEKRAASVTLTESAPLPTQLGWIHADEGIGMIKTRSGFGSCVDYINTGYADIRIELSDEAQPYADQWIYQLRVDGYLHPRFDSDPYLSPHMHAAWDSSRGRNRDRIFAACNGELESHPDLRDPMFRGTHPYLEPGIHEVAMVGTLPDGTELVTVPIQVDLRCPEPSDAGTASAGADAATDADAASGKPQVEPSQHAAYGCSAVSGTHAPKSAAWLWLFAIIALRRRTRAA